MPLDVSRGIVFRLTWCAPLALAACHQDPPARAPEEHPPVLLSPPAPLPPEETPPPEAPATPSASVGAQPVEPGVSATGAPTRGALPKAVIDEELKAAGPAIQACYERGLKAKPHLRGQVNVNFVIGTDGKVAHADAVEADDALTDAATLDCIVAVIAQLEFPPPRGGRVFINYPIQLEPSKAAP